MFSFEWSRAIEGYQWWRFEPEHDAPDLPFLDSDAAWVLEAKDGGTENYRPLEEFTGLYRQFAELAPKQEPVLAFADRCGHLGSDLVKNPEDWDDAGLDSRRQVIGERLSNWAEHIRVMKDAVEVWDLVATGDIKNLVRLEREQHLFTSVPEHRVQESTLVEQPHAEETLGDVQHRDDDPRSPYVAGHPVQFDAGSPSAIIATGRTFVTNEVNIHLLEQGVTPRLEVDPSGGPRFYVVPRTLLGAMWLQFAESISQQKEYRRCRECSTPFEISTAGARSDSKFCTAACKSTFHNSKRRKVRELRSKGHLLQKIAKQFDTDIPTLKKWLGEPSRPRKRTRRT